MRHERVPLPPSYYSNRLPPFMSAVVHEIVAELVIVDSDSLVTPEEPVVNPTEP